MTKKHFIALADTLRELNPAIGKLPWQTNSGQKFQWERTRDALAEFCKAQNPHFNRERWLSYIAGDCGPNGGKAAGNGR